MFAQAQQRAAFALFEIQLDCGQGVGCVATLKHEARGRKHLEHDTFLIVIDVFFGSPIAPAQNDLSAWSQVDLAAARPPTTRRPLAAWSKQTTPSREGRGWRRCGESRDLVRSCVLLDVALEPWRRCSPRTDKVVSQRSPRE